MTNRYIRFEDFPEPPKPRRPKVRRIITDFFINMEILDNPRETIENAINALIDVVIEEIKNND